jgi:nitrogenase molybdenum-cofactor synthesis protein NifE
MKKMLKYLSPFAPDQSGVCGVLYELGGLIVICDAGGCTGNICGFDEPRWFTKKSAVFSAGLRDMDAIMGRDDKLIEKLSKAQEALKGEFTALVATPVPAVIGTDMKALKRMAEKKTGVPCISINAIGTKYYDEGESQAWLELFKEFTGKEDVSSDMILSGRTGIIGATPLETGYSSGEIMNEYCLNYGIKEPVIFGIETGLDAIRQAGKLSKNLVVSAAGIKAAKYLEENFGIPYEVGYPFIPNNVITDMKALLQDGNGISDGRIKNILIIHSQFAANELRNRIRSNKDSIINSDLEIDTATFFMYDENYAESNDIRLAGEDELWEIAESGKYDLIIADTDIKRMLDAAKYKGEFIAFPHFAISGVPMDEGKTLYN